MKVVIRVDSSQEMGIGHLMRCLTLAKALRKQNNSVLFICRELPGNVISKLRKDQFHVEVLPYMKNTNGEEPGPPLIYKNWLSVTQVQDAQDCMSVLHSIEADWVIVDHYGIDYRWESVIKQKCQNILVIDDLADRKHDCEILLDQNLGRLKEDYESLVPVKTRCLLGSKYTLLREEFNQLRNESLKARWTRPVETLLISMGGTDPYNSTQLILDTLSTCRVSLKKIVAVLDKASPNIKKIQSKISQSILPIELKISPSNMSKIICNSDIGIGAAGSTTWERCCLGLPTILYTFSKNQEFIAKEIEKNEIGMVGGAIQDIPLTLCPLIEELSQMETKNKYVRNSSLVCDGLGVERVVHALLNYP